MVRKPFLLALVALFLAAAPSTAQELSARYEKRAPGVRSASFGVDLSFSGPRYERRPAVRRHITRRVRYGGSIWIPGHYETVRRRVFVPGSVERIWVGPVYETRYDECHEPYRVLIREGHWKTVQHPGHYEIRLEKVWVPGGWCAR